MERETRQALAHAARTARRAGVTRTEWLLAIETRLRGGDTEVPGLHATGLDDAWHHEESLGWAYQFFNDATARAEARQASAAPRDATELALRNQFFTPRYVVEFLIQNTLGVLLGVPGPYTVGEVTAYPGDVTRVLDPACGSGHFLLGAYALLIQAGYGPGEALDVLWGVELDVDLAEVARRALCLRALRHGASAPVVRHILVAPDTLGVLNQAWELPDCEVVLQNPPFGACVPGDKAYLQRTYPRSAHELACTFVERGFQLLCPGGRLGVLMTRAPFFLASSQRWREEFVLKAPCQIPVFADLGAGVLDGAMVEVAALVLRKRAAYGGAMVWQAPDAAP